jgi:hypothetical protein
VGDGKWQFNREDGSWKIVTSAARPTCLRTRNSCPRSQVIYFQALREQISRLWPPVPLALHPTIPRDAPESPRSTSNPGLEVLR